MKKTFLMAATLLLTMLGFTSCNDSDNTPKEFSMLVARGAYIINAGIEEGNIDGALTYFDYSTVKASQNVYRTKNGASLGMDVNDAVTWGSNVYIVGAGQKTIYVADRNTVARKANISTGRYTPRHIACNGSFVFVSTAENKVLAIDTLSMSIMKEYDCGNSPQGIDAIGNYIITADSNDGKGEGASITVINTEKNETKKYEGKDIVNPTNIMTFIDQAGYLHVYYVDQGKLDANNNQSGHGVYELGSTGTSKKIAEGTMATIDGYGNLYVINAPATTPATKPTYIMYNLYSGQNKVFISGSDIAAPAAIKADESSDIVLITSYYKDGDQINYSRPGYAIAYSSSGSQKAKFDTGVKPATICFNLGVEKFTY